MSKQVIVNKLIDEIENLSATRSCRYQYKQNIIFMIK